MTGRGWGRTQQRYVYIMANASHTLYTGVTNDLQRRVWEHKRKIVEGFTKKYNLTRLVYYEVLESIRQAIEREKQIKGWLRCKKIGLIESVNPTWEDLAEGWFESSRLAEPQDSRLRSEWQRGSSE